MLTIPKTKKSTKIRTLSTARLPLKLLRQIYLYRITDLIRFMKIEQDMLRIGSLAKNIGLVYDVNEYSDTCRQQLPGKTLFMDFKPIDAIEWNSLPKSA